MSRLWLLTDHYPFGEGESFIAAELPYLLAHAAAVHIVPTGRGALQRAPGARQVPAGVVVRTDIAQALEHSRRQSAWVHMRRLRRICAPTADACRQALAELRRAGRTSPQAAGHNVRRLLQAVLHAAMLAEVLGNTQDAPAAGDGLYAYWLNASALGAHWACPNFALVARAHGHDLFAERHRGRYLPLQAHLIETLGALYCISEDGAAHARAHFGPLQPNIHVMPLGVGATELRAQPSTDGALRVASCARMIAVKDLDLWIAALARVKTRVAWTHLGDGPDAARLMQACTHLPPHVQVHWAGAVAHDEVLARLTSQPCDVFVNTSRHEGRPVSIMEALSVGLPVRATRVGGTGEMLPDEWLWDRRAGAAGIADSLDAFAQLSAPARLAQRTLALAHWQRHANADVLYPAFARHLTQTLQLR